MYEAITFETQLRVEIFSGVFLLMALWEALAPKRRLTVSKTGRWGNNIGIILLDTLLVRLLLPGAGVALAAAAENADWGVLRHLPLGFWGKTAIAILFLDLVVYLQHLMFHATPLLWRLHMMHHADMDIDVTTGLRFHPIEILISMGIKLSAIAVIGPTIAAVIAFEIILNATAMFNHGNIRLPAGIDRMLRLLVVTPDMHRVHHSVVIRETNSNFGFNFPWWDRLFGTYRAQPVRGHTDMTIGLAQFRDPGRITLLHLIMLPFTGDPGGYSLNRLGRDPEVLGGKIPDNETEQPRKK